MNYDKIPKDLEFPSYVHELKEVIDTVEPRLQTIPEMRRHISRFVDGADMDKVYPDLVIGDCDAATNVNYLVKNGITHIVNAADNETGPARVKTGAEFYEKANITYLGLDLIDLPFANVAKHFDRASAFIDDALSNNGKVLVHCKQGRSRSASIIIAFLMICRRFSAAKALAQLRKYRDVRPNNSFLQQLATLDLKLFRERYAEWRESLSSSSSDSDSDGESGAKRHKKLKESHDIEKAKENEETNNKRKSETLTSMLDSVRNELKNAKEVESPENNANDSNNPKNPSVKRKNRKVDDDSESKKYNETKVTVKDNISASVNNDTKLNKSKLTNESLRKEGKEKTLLNESCSNNKSEKENSVRKRIHIPSRSPSFEEIDDNVSADSSKNETKNASDNKEVESKSRSSDNKEVELCVEKVKSKSSENNESLNFSNKKTETGNKDAKQKKSTLFPNDVDVNFTYSMTNFSEAQRSEKTSISDEHDQNADVSMDSSEVASTLLSKNSPTDVIIMKNEKGHTHQESNNANHKGPTDLESNNANEKIQKDLESNNENDKGPTDLESNNANEKGPTDLESNNENHKGPTDLESNNENEKGPTDLESNNANEKRQKDLESNNENDKGLTDLESNNENEKEDKYQGANNIHEKEQKAQNSNICTDATEKNIDCERINYEENDVIPKQMESDTNIMKDNDVIQKQMEGNTNIMKDNVETNAENESPSNLENCETKYNANENADVSKGDCEDIDSNGAEKQYENVHSNSLDDGKSEPKVQNCPVPLNQSESKQHLKSPMKKKIHRLKNKENKSRSKSSVGSNDLSESPDFSISRSHSASGKLNKFKKVLSPETNPDPDAVSSGDNPCLNTDPDAVGSGGNPCLNTDPDAVGSGDNPCLNTDPDAVVSGDNPCLKTNPDDVDRECLKLDETESSNNMEDAIDNLNNSSDQINDHQNLQKDNIKQEHIEWKNKNQEEYLLSEKNYKLQDKNDVPNNSKNETEVEPSTNKEIDEVILFKRNETNVLNANKFENNGSYNNDSISDNSKADISPSNMLTQNVLILKNEELNELSNTNHTIDLTSNIANKAIIDSNEDKQKEYLIKTEDLEAESSSYELNVDLISTKMTNVDVNSKVEMNDESNRSLDVSDSFRELKISREDPQEMQSQTTGSSNRGLKEVGDETNYLKPSKLKLKTRRRHCMTLPLKDINVTLDGSTSPPGGADHPESEEDEAGRNTSIDFTYTIHSNKKNAAVSDTKYTILSKSNDRIEVEKQISKPLSLNLSGSESRQRKKFSEIDREDSFDFNRHSPDQFYKIRDVNVNATLCIVPCDSQAPTPCDPLCQTPAEMFEKAFEYSFKT